MLEFVSVCFANLMPAIACGAILLGMLGRPLNRLGVGFATGAGYLLGVAFVALLNWLGQWHPWPDSPLPVAVVLLMVTVAGVWLLLRQHAGTRPVPGERLAPLPLLSWSILLVMLVVNGYMMAGEALTRPIYPWDAWSAWSVKARVWIELGSEVDFVSFQQWLASGQPMHYTTEAWNYPELIPRFQLWVMQWVGHWDDQLALTPWLFAGAAMLLTTYHALRLLGTGPLPAMAVTFLIGSIPILNVQIALAGLVDLWIAAELVLFCICVLLWADRGERRWIAVALAALAAAAATKLEGLVWAILCLPVLLFTTSRARLRRIGYSVGVGALVLWWVFDGFSFRLGDGLQFTVTKEVIALPYLGRYPLAFTNQLGSLARSFLSLPNWHLTWYLLLPAVLWAAVRYRSEPLGRGLAIFAAVSLGFLFVLFFMTRAGIWAESMTASNRLALHFVPACMLWAGLLLARNAAERTPT